MLIFNKFLNKFFSKKPYDIQGPNRRVGDGVDISYLWRNIDHNLIANISLTSQQEEDVNFLIQADVLKQDYFLPADTNLSLPEAIKLYIYNWNSSKRRKLFPGFCPAHFKAYYPNQVSNLDPLRQYVSLGRPAGKWNFEVIYSDYLFPSAVTHIPKVALHIHCYYPDLLIDIVNALNSNNFRPDLLVTIPSTSMYEDVKKYLASFYSGHLITLKTIPNRGRDVYPFLLMLTECMLNTYEIVGHVHTKKTAFVPDPAFGKRWFDFLIQNLLGGETNMMDKIIHCFCTDSGLGLVQADDPNIIGWGTNRHIGNVLSKKLKLGDLPSDIQFPIGNMFWSKVDALKPLLDLKLDLLDFPTEPIDNDGTILHALERIIPLLVAHQGYKTAVTHVHGITR